MSPGRGPKANRLSTWSFLESPEIVAAFAKEINAGIREEINESPRPSKEPWMKKR
jgi:hypothetical protein